MPLTYLKQIYYCLLFLAFLLSLFSANRRKQPLLVFPYLLLVGICFQIVEDILEWVRLPHTFIFNIYDLIEYPLYTFYFYFLYIGRRIRTVIIIALIIYISSFFLYFTFVKSFWEESFSSLSCIQAIFMTFFSLYFFYDLIQSNRYFHLPSYPHFYINTANLIHFSLSLLALSFNAVLNKRDPILADNVLYITRLSNILQNSPKGTPYFQSKLTPHFSIAFQIQN